VVRMRNVLHKLAMCMAMMALLVFTGVIASAAEFETIQYEANPGNGTVLVEEFEAGQAKITLTPASGYSTASIALKTGSNDNLLSTQEGSNNVFYCEIPDAESTLTVTFRRTRIAFSQDQVVLQPGGALSVPIAATVSYTDGDTATRADVYSQAVIWSSSDDTIVTVDGGCLTAGSTPGFAIITATPVYGNAGSAASFYVIVEDLTNPEYVGTIQVNSYFNAERFLNEGNTGTAFLTFRNTSAQAVNLNTKDFYKVYTPTDDFYTAAAANTTPDPVTFASVTAGEEATDENEAARKALADSYFTVSNPVPVTYTVNPNDVVTFGNYGQLGSSESLFSVVLGGDFEEALARHGKTWTAKKLVADVTAGRINLDQFSDALAALADEIGYDFAEGYNPFTYETKDGGVCLNYELYMQAYDTDFASAAGMSTKITKVELLALMDYLSKSSYSLLSNNSANVALAGWNLVTAAHPTYKLDNTIASTATPITVPMLVKSNIVLTSSSLAGDGNVNLYSSVGVIKPGAVSGTSSTDSIIYSLFGQIKNYLNVNIISLNSGETYNTHIIGNWSTTNVSVAYATKKGTIYGLVSGYALVTCTEDETSVINAYLVIVN